MQQTTCSQVGKGAVSHWSEAWTQLRCQCSCLLN